MRKSQQSALRRLAVTTLVTLASAVTAVTTQAAYIVNATEVGGDVVFAGSGSLDTSAWFELVPITLQTGVNASESIFAGPPATTRLYEFPTNFAGPTSIGPGTTFNGYDAGTGDVTGLRFVDQNLYTPNGYVSGAALQGTSTLNSTTFANIGLTPGTYEWTWGSGASADSYTLNVGAVPIPAAAWLFGSGLLGLVGVARRKARA